MARMNKLTEFLDDVASAIKEKIGDDDPIPAYDFDRKIRSIETKGDYQAKTVEVTSNGTTTVIPDSEYDALSEINVNTNVVGNYQAKTMNVEQNGEYVLEPDQNYDGISQVRLNVNVPPPAGLDDVIEGYYYNNKFYEENTHTTEISGETETIYIDLPTNKLYRWDGTDFIELVPTISHKYVGTITGDGATTSFVITHNLNSRDIVINIYDTATYEDVIVDIIRTTVNTITVYFAVAPVIGTNYNVVIIV